MVPHISNASLGKKDIDKLSPDFKAMTISQNSSNGKLY